MLPTGLMDLLNYYRLSSILCRTGDHNYRFGRLLFDIYSVHHYTYYDIPGA